MLELKVHDGDREVVLQFEHSLLALSKWEAKHKKPFLTTSARPPTEMIDYFQCMLVSPEVDPDLVYMLEPSELDDIANYMNDSQTASSVPRQPSKLAAEVTTSELIYYWLVALKIPFQPTETWHLNRVMMLIEITNYKNQPAKKRKPSEVMSDWRAANERQKKMFGTNG